MPRSATPLRRLRAVTGRASSGLVTGGERDLLLGATITMVAAQLGFRAWALYPSFFYGDDYRLVREGGRDGLGWRYLIAPYDAQFMPYGRFVAWLASRTENLDWTVLATTTLVAQTLASVACVWMLVTLFGWRWSILAPLALYLSCAMTMPATMWWAAGLNQVPLQAVFFASLAAWVSYLRGRRWRWLAITFLILGLGLLCYVKTLLLFPVLGFVALAYFSEGGPVRRVVFAVRRYWPAIVLGLAAAAGFAVYYATQVPQIGSAARPEGAAKLADTMVGNSFAVGAFGGPWRWNDQIAPVGQAQPPDWAVHLVWTLAALLIAYLFLRRERTLRAWVLLAGYVAADYVLLLTSRAQIVGSVSGTEYRYLTDAACALVLAVSLASMPLRGARESSTPRAEPLLTRGVGRGVVVVAVVALTASGVYSSWTYAKIWHDDNPGADYLGATLDSLVGVPEVDLADQPVPEDVMAPFSLPYNRTGTLLPLLTDAVRFPDTTDRLHVLDEDGRVTPAELDVATSSYPGPDAGCGWKVTSAGPSRIPLEGGVNEFEWWLQIDYVASADSALQVQAGDNLIDTEVFQGLGTLYVRTDDGSPYKSVVLGGLDPDVTLCVDTIDVGTPEPEEAP